MKRVLIFCKMTGAIIALVAALSAVASASGGAAGSRPQSKPIAEGLVLRAVDGRLTASVAADEWVFEFESDVNEAGITVKAGTKLKLLPCGLLERLIGEPAPAGADAGPDSSRPTSPEAERRIRLWAMVTQYEGANYLFPMYYLPLKKTEQSPSVSETVPTKAEQTPQINIAEPNDEIGIPAEITAMLRQDKIRRQETGDRRQENYESRTTDFAQNRVLVDAVGFVRQGKIGPVFVPDAIGRNVSREHFGLLPCYVLELAQREPGVSRAVSERVRFTVAGLVTEYKGNKYLLLQRAIRLYSHGNFDR